MIRFSIPLKTKSLNESLRGRWEARAGATKHERRKVALLCPPWTEGPVIVVTLIRLSPGRLDDDNLRGALKHVRDSVAAKYGFDDGSPLVRWQYDQLRGEPGVQVVIARAEPVSGCAHAVGTDDVCVKCRNK